VNSESLVAKVWNFAHVLRDQGVSYQAYKMARDKLDLDVFWLTDDGLDDPDLLPPPDEVVAEVVESLEAALASFRSVAAKLQGV
jgi:hypothetical protein